MAGIAGIFSLDGVPVDPRQLGAMAAAMEYRGPDGIRTWQDGPVGFVHCHFWTTPEDAGEEQPICSPDGRYWITADARVDNREELIPFLTGKGFIRKRIPTDAEVILAAYECWGEGCAQHVVGDFAFAVWDARARQLFLARDVIGIRQLYYAVSGKTLYFGTTIGAVLAALPNRPSLNDRLIEEFLRRSCRLWTCQTVYSDILRLPPAYNLIANAEGVSRRLYYVLGSEPRPDCASDQEWVEAFRAVFDEAVRCRLRSRTPVGILTGGGTDSSAIACVAHELVRREADPAEVRLVSAVYEDTPGADERNYFDAVADRCTGFSSTRVVCDGCWALREFGSDGGYPLDEPEVYSTRSLTLALFRAVKDNGSRVVLAGEGANQALAHAVYFKPTALRGVALRDLPAELKWFKKGTKTSWIRLLFWVGVGRCIPEQLWEWVQSRRSSSVQGPPWVKQLALPPDGQGCLLDHRYTDPPGLGVWAKVAAHDAVRSSYDLARYSALDVTTAYVGLEWRLPFLDRRLVDLLLSIPGQLQSQRGMDRIILRESMRGTLPEQVRVRRKHSHNIELIHRGLREKERKRIEELLQNPGAEALGFVDSRALKEAFASYWAEQNEGRDLTRFLCLEAWLRDVE